MAKKRPEIDLCKIDTARVRALSVEQLKASRRRLITGGSSIWRTRGELNVVSLPKKERAKPIGLLERLMFNLQMGRTVQPLSPHSAEAYRRTYNEEPPDDDRIRASYEREANRIERQIWDKQAKAGCKLPDQEIVARDAEREGRKADAAKLRAERRRPPTPYKGRKPIIR